MKREHNDILICFLHPEKPQLLEFCSQLGYTTEWIKYNGKKDIFSAFRKILKLFRRVKPSLVHAHLFDASLIALSAAKVCFVKQRIHTRHHASMHHEYFPNTVKYDKIINSLSTKIIAISKNISEILIEKEGVDESKIYIIYHGFDIPFFNAVNADRVDKLKTTYSIPTDKFYIGMISRYTHWKGIQFVIPAFKRILKE